MTTGAEYRKPMPEINDLNRPHWEGANQHEFRVQRCRGCGHMWFPPMTNCSRCLSTDLEWFVTGGKGKVFSFIVYHQGWLPGYLQETPYNVALIELDEGVRFISNVVGIPNDQIEVDMPVEATYEEVTPEVTIPRFRPAAK